MKDRLNRIFAEQADIFRFTSEEGKNKVIREIERRFEDRGSIVVSSVNGATIPNFENILFAVAQPYLSIRSQGKYVPQFADLRDEKAKEIQQEDTKRVIDFFLDKMGIAFKGEHLEDFTYRSLVKNKIAEGFLYTGTGEDGEIRFRRFEQGMFSQDFEPADVINHFASPFIDQKRTQVKQLENVSIIESALLKKYGYPSRAQLPHDKVKLFEDDFNEELKAPVAFTKKRLPEVDQDEYRREFSKRIAFKLGIEKLEAITMQQKQRVDYYVNERMENLNSLPEVRNDNILRFEEKLTIPTQNNIGVTLPLEML